MSGTGSILYSFLLVLCCEMMETSKTIGNNHFDNYQDILKEIYEEQHFDSMLLVQNHKEMAEINMLEEIHQYPVPKVLLSNESFFYRRKFNSNILAIIIMQNRLDHSLMAVLAQTLECIRHTRILTIAVVMQRLEREFRYDFLESCRQYNLTNNLLHFVYINDSLYQREFYILKPYPRYHWTAINLDNTYGNELRYFHQHWRNMQNKTLLTYTDCRMPKSLCYMDNEGKLHLNGLVVRLVMLFAEHFNASLKMAFPLSVSNPLHLNVILREMVRENLLDIPMVVDVSVDSEKWLNFSDVYEYDKGQLIVPCAQQLRRAEVYTALLNPRFLGCIIVSSILLSLIHSLIDFLLEGWWNFSHLLLSDRIFPGFLGQSFVTCKSHSKSLKILYLWLFVLGLYVNTLFSVNLSSLFTHPSYHAQIETLNDLIDSPLRILLYYEDAQSIGTSIPNYRDFADVTQNSSHPQSLRNSWNTSYGYYSSLGLWQIINRKQSIFTRKIFCSFENLTIFPYLPWTIPLQHNSPYMEALNYLIHWVHAFGFMDYWHSSTSEDITKLKELTPIYQQNDERGSKSLKMRDMYWVWMIVIGGLVSSCISSELNVFVKRDTKNFVRKKCHTIITFQSEDIAGNIVERGC
ncbi:uncharacterized protein LOC142224463 [Haematobia irritans]|uniref:uncharacterized protein LOC142224463 n=1 Tax=Haematobia irritans TaxID=7368 RepID=UPI003F4FD5BD